MKTFNCILGVFSILGAVYCMFFPGATFLSSGLVVAILLGVLGICSIFEYVRSRKQGEGQSKNLVAGGVFQLIFGIAAAVMMVLAVFVPAIRAILDIFILVMFVGWMIFSGVSGIFKAVSVKKATGSKVWIFTLIMSILLIITGLYGITHLMYAAFAIGYMIGIELMVYGVRLIMSAFEDKE
ncbi:MAG: DUF308 domain-containing protein [Clostridia bacterium]|nr:DUF308 domain-containing protein [Clostridia bacterium]